MKLIAALRAWFCGTRRTERAVRASADLAERRFYDAAAAHREATTRIGVARSPSRTARRQ